MYAQPYSNQQHQQYQQQAEPRVEENEDLYKASVDEMELNPIQKSLRVNFVRKVFAITAAQLLITAVIAHIFVNRRWFFKLNYHFPIMVYLFGIVAAILSLALSLSTTLSRRVPLNYILLGVFTIAEAYCVGFTAGYYDQETVLAAVYLTAAVVGSLTFYALRSKTEISYYGGFIVLITLGSLVLSFFSWMTRFHFLDSLLFAGSCVLSGLYFIYDVKMLMGGRVGISLDDYIKGAMHLYLDIIRIFMNILQMMQKRAEEEKEKEERRRR